MSLLLFLNHSAGANPVVAHMQSTGFRDIGQSWADQAHEIEHVLSNPAQLKHEIAEHLVMKGFEEDSTVTVLDNFIDEKMIKETPKDAAARVANILTICGDPAKLKSMGPHTRKRLMTQVGAAEALRDSALLQQVVFDRRNQIDEKLRMSPAERLADLFQGMSPEERKQHQYGGNYDLSDFAPGR